MGRIFLLVCGVVAAALLVGAAPSPRQGGQAEQAKATRDLAQAVETLSGTVTKQAQANEASLLSSSCEPGRDQRQSDLCAQWKAADAAREAARWAFWSTIVSVAGIFGLWLNLRQGRHALAKAREANEIARLSAERQLRAYVGVEKLKINTVVAGARLIVWMTLRNRGQTPARQLRIRCCAVRCWGVPSAGARIKFDRAEKLYDLGADQSTSQPIVLTEEPLTQLQIDTILRGEAAFVVGGYLSYRDAFGRLRRTIFRAFFDQSSIHNPDADGNCYLNMPGRNVRSA